MACIFAFLSVFLLFAVYNKAKFTNCLLTAACGLCQTAKQEEIKFMKKVAIAIVLVVVCLVLTACGANAQITELQAELKQAQIELAQKEYDLAAALAVLENSKIYPDTVFTTASVPYPSYDKGVTPATLVTMSATYSYSGAYLIGTVNQNGSPNISYMIYSVYAHEGEYYVVMGVGAKLNQTQTNLKREGEGYFVWIANYDAEGSTANAKYATMGIKMFTKAVDDVTPYYGYFKLNTEKTYYIFKVTEFWQIG